ncbi:MAG TPA: hypothetical protein VES03_01415 [Motilibacterales bacterium]|nr:hypothetical protein [Motilibacterales bacterium]
MRDLREAYGSAPEPTLDDLVGTHEGQIIGPALLRAVIPRALSIGGMPGWCGKRFEMDPGAPEGPAVGVNLLRSKGEVRDSIPMTARVGPSRLDGRPALVISYPPDGPFVWARVIDELRPFGEATLLGLTFEIPRVPLWVPFLLRRVSP